MYSAVFYFEYFIDAKLNTLHDRLKQKKKTSVGKKREWVGQIMDISENI